MIIKSTGTNGTPCPPGNHVARCIAIIDLGTQDDTYQGKPISRRLVQLRWELPNETKVFDPEKGEQPYVLSKDYTASLGEKANLKKDLQSWRGKEFTEDELKGFDTKAILGVPCLVMVIHNENGNAKITAVSALPKGTVVPAQVNPSVYFSLDDFSKETFDGLSDYLREKIAKSPEFKAVGSATVPTEASIEDEDIPF